MADFIMAMADRAQILVTVDNADPNENLRYEVVDGYRSNASVSPEGLLIPLRPGPVLVHVYDENDNLVRELIGVIRPKARFQFDRSMQVGHRRVCFLVKGAVSGINLGAANSSGVDVHFKGACPPASVPGIFDVQLKPEQGLMLPITWRTLYTGDASYRIDIFKLDGTPAKQVEMGRSWGELHEGVIDVSDLLYGEYRIQVVAPETNTSSTLVPYFLASVTSPTVRDVTLQMDGEDRFLVGWSSNELAASAYVIQIVAWGNEVLGTFVFLRDGVSPFYATLDAMQFGAGDFQARVTHARSGSSAMSNTLFYMGSTDGGQNVATTTGAIGSAGPGDPADAFNPDSEGWTSAVGGGWIGQIFPTPIQIRSVEFIQSAGSDYVAVEFLNSNGQWESAGGPYLIDATPNVFSVIDIAAYGKWNGWRLSPVGLNADQTWQLAEVKMYEWPALGYGTQPYGYGNYGDP